MQYLLTQEEYDALKNMDMAVAKAELRKENDKKLSGFCCELVDGLSSLSPFESPKEYCKNNLARLLAKHKIS